MSNLNERASIGRYFAQGAAANALTIYVLGVAYAGYFSNPYSFLMTLVVPFYMIFAAIIGALVAGCIWGVERACNFQSSIAVRTLLVTAMGISFTLILLLNFEDVLDLSLVTEFLIGTVMVCVPASIAVGTRFRPVRIIFPESDEINLKPNWSSWLSGLGGLVLRLISLIAFSETLFCTICLFRSRSMLSVEYLIASAIATVYFAVSAIVTFGTHDWHWLLAVGTVLNAPLAAWVFSNYSITSGAGDQSALLVLTCGFLLLWGVFVVGRLVSPFDQRVAQSERRRILPVTFFEIEIRHALNRW